MAKSKFKQLDVLLQTAGSKYLSDSSKANFTTCDSAEIFRKEIPENLMYKMGLSNIKYKIKGSIGQGTYADIPWVCIFDRAVTESATKGVYLVQLYKKDGSGMFLGLGQGITYFQKKFRSKIALRKSREVALRLRECINIPVRYKIDKINLLSNNFLGKGYETGFIAGLYYDFKKMPNAQTILNDHIELMKFYDDIINLKGTERSYEEFAEYLLEVENDIVFIDEEDNENDPEFELGKIKKFVIDENEGLEVPEETIDIIDTKEPKKETVVNSKGKKCYPRKNSNIYTAFRKADFKCEFDQMHASFPWAKYRNKKYVEGHHLVPISNHHKFNNSLDVNANIICLCATCHRAIHFGKMDTRKIIIDKLFLVRKKRLANVGISVSLNELYEYYKISD